MSNAPRLKLTGYQSASQIDSIFASRMVDVAYVDEITDDGIYVIADNPDWPSDSRDFDWLCSAIRETLEQCGVANVRIESAPPTNT